MTTTMIPPEVLARPRVQHLLGRAALYQALALAFAYPEEEALSRFDALAADLDGHPAVERLGVGGALRAARAARAEVDADRLAPVHFALFEGNVLCSAHETEYIRDPFAKAAQLADMAGFYAAFGMQVSTRHQATPDNIGVELEFMAHISQREAYAAVQEWDERALIARQAGRTFLEAHLGRWTRAFTLDLCERAGEAAALRDDPATGRWYHALGELLRQTVVADLETEGVYPSLLHSRVVDDETAEPPTCPLAEEVQLIDIDSILVNGTGD
ncbi:MAG: hypothetical protein AMXMBFR23_01510 [Chloroflexota bacterium]